MLTSFTQRKTEEVSQTVAGLHNQLDTGRTAVGSSFAELNNLSTAAAGHLEVLLLPSQLLFPDLLISIAPTLVRVSTTPLTHLVLHLMQPS